MKPTGFEDSSSDKLHRMLSSLESRAQFDHECLYLNELQDSLSSLHAVRHGGKQLNKDCLAELPRALEKHLAGCERSMKALYGSLLKAASPTPGSASQTIHRILFEAGRYPRICQVFFLQNLRNGAWKHLSGLWKDAVVAYGVAITLVQQARRLVKVQNDEVTLLRELENKGRQGWDPSEFPEWLLLECESEIMVRDVQNQIAKQMIGPPGGQNAVMQLNMGEGKSSVIIPIVAAALGNGSQLVRVIVGKPQAKQMYQILISKLAGLLNRPVYLMPFSRAIRMDSGKADAISQLTNDCIKEGGVMLVQPEHLLSFQLMGLESQLDDRDGLAGQLLKLQSSFDEHARDLVDESDENFSVKFELVYTVGQQQPVDYSPERWVLIQDVLRLVAKFSAAAKKKFPQSVDLDDRHDGRFPRIRILRGDAQGAIFGQVASSICSTGLNGFPVARQTQTTRDAVRTYITKPDLSQEERAAVEKGPFWGETTSKPILLLRGLLAGGILAFSFGQKRWRVNYGTDGKRERPTRLAVPFRAKDSPTARSEFSHPDVVIVLTCLSYYYGGLDDEQLFSIFELLARSDSPGVEYQLWIKTATDMPLPFRQLEGVNLRDRTQCAAKVFPCLRFAKGAIDYYLSKLVFAKEAREFPSKLSASGWDLGKAKNRPMTGFSGTNDSRYVLPLEVKQLDLPEQKHTNALVLEYLLRPENSVKLVRQGAGRTVFDSKVLLGMIEKMSTNTRVVLDVGAQVIDAGNREVAERWLRRHEGDGETQAVVFFSDADELVVLNKAGSVEELQVSPFATRLDQCLVFLDEAHTRGTDLKLPANYQAAVTLGANLTKDRLVQACMRMRRLGKGQSVVFCVPWEVEHKIRQQRGGRSPSTGPISVSDVLCWVIAETCLDLQRTMPLWLAQGCRFYRQGEMWKKGKGVGDQSSARRLEWAQGFLEDEARSLKDQYQPGRADGDLGSLLRPVREDVRTELQRRCEAFGLTRRQRTAALQEEQERELAPEAERLRQVERPPPVQAEAHDIHPDVRHFVAHGDTSPSPSFLAELPRLVWATGDFARTVERSQGYSDAFQRSVQWILTNKTRDGERFRLLIISPYEAQELLPSISASEKVLLRIYSPRLSLEFRSLDHLALYSIPARQSEADLAIPEEAVTQLNLFAGQLYLSSSEEYQRVCDALGLASTPVDDSVVLGPDGFIPPGGDGDAALVNRSGFSRSPVKFFKVLLTKIRQNCETIERTHMGKVLDGVLLEPEDLEEEPSEDGGDSS
ncbi:hypothetical protein CDD83_4568 [Cordyceps sp. RAO-2017]|nr:hypothetical protein CDD83_4568 [Cordyceps sp. RAO-2017]